ncbi:MAG: hypothetical protein NC087_04410 [Anaeroplasma bactoclasticum]|nr:hypothetical protein [Anaeroplasma bactoclasticum]
MYSRVFETQVTKEDYLQFAGIDLDAELASLAINDVGDNPAPRFIKGVEDWCRTKLMNPPYCWGGEFITEWQRTQFKEGVMHQIAYVLKNGNISNDSGYNMANGTLIPRLELEKIGMASNARDCFRLGGLMNLARGCYL